MGPGNEATMVIEFQSEVEEEHGQFYENHVYLYFTPLVMYCSLLFTCLHLNESENR